MRSVIDAAQAAVSAPWGGAGRLQAPHIARIAVRALYAELALEPKPGLVSFRDNGSHTDMNAHTFFKSLFALRHYFGHMARAGAQGLAFEHLQALGLAAEARMLRATGGINTHRGAVFSLGLLCAGAGALSAQGAAFSATALRGVLQQRWGGALGARALAASRKAPTSNGQLVARQFGLRSAHEEAALGWPTLFEITLPALRAAADGGLSSRAAKVQSLFITMAHLDDTNVAHRGGITGLQQVKAQAAGFIAAGGVGQHDWVARARSIHADWVAQRLSPGGAADLMACACFVRELESTNLAHSRTHTHAHSDL